MGQKTFGVAVFAALILACLIPMSAPAHPVNTVEGHIAEDSVEVTPAMEEWLGERTEAATEADAALAAAAVTGDEGEVGQWGPVIDWPVVGIHIALLQSGKVLAYDSSADQLAVDDHSFTRATVWDPTSGSHVDAMLSGFNIFCSGLAHLMDGTLFTAGGNKNSALDGLPNSYTFDEETNGWDRGPDMAEERWYPSVTPLNNGEMLVTDGVEGRVDAPEVRKTDGSFRALSTAARDLPLYPWIDVAPNGRAFYSGPSTTMRSLDTSGTGAWTGLGPRDTIARSYGSHALYDIGKILVAGGGPSTPSATTINLNGSTPQVTPTAPMETGRRQHNLTVLADGTVLATGGNSSGESLVDLDAGVYAAELWDPATGEWTTLDSMQVTRQYHSSALLLPDGRVLSAGGGICGDCNAGLSGEERRDLHPALPVQGRRLGRARTASRDHLRARSGVVGNSFSVGTPQAGSIDKLAMMRLGAVTHSVNMEQRYVPLEFTANGGSLVAETPANPNIAPPGVYMLFAIDSNGVPSVAKMVRIEGSAPGPLAPTITDTDPDSPSKDNSPEVSGTGAAAGSTVRVYGEAGCTGPVLGTGTATVFNGTSGITATVPSDRTTNLRVRATDTAGNTSPCSAAFPYTEDSTGPDTIITAKPPATGPNHTVTFAFASTEPGSTFDCRFDTEVFAACTSPLQRTLPVGKHVFRVRATDVSKNRDGTPAKESFRITN